MRRTHVMHTRDNRRGTYYAQHDHRDPRPALTWLREGARQIMLVDGARVASVRPNESEEALPWEKREPTIAEIHEGPHALTLRAFDDSDSARLFCESLFAA